MRPAGWCYVVGLFGFSGASVFLLVFGSAPNSLAGILQIGLATAFAGVISGAVICDGTRVPDRAVSVFAGIATGVLLHPIYWVIASALDGQLFSPAEILRASCFSLLIVGVITVPAGIVTAMLIREVLEIVSPANDSE